MPLSDHQKTATIVCMCVLHWTDRKMDRQNW